MPAEELREATERLHGGAARLREVAARSCTADPEELCDRLLAELTGVHRADDIALLALTRTEPPQLPGA